MSYYHMPKTIIAYITNLYSKLEGKVSTMKWESNTRGWREPGNMILQRGRILGLVLFKRRVTDQGVGPAWQRQSGAGAGEGFLVLFKIIEQDHELALK